MGRGKVTLPTGRQWPKRKHMPMPKKRIEAEITTYGFKVILDSGDEDGERRELTDEEVKEARFLMDHTGALVRDESYVGEDGEIVRYLRHPKDVCIVPR